MSDETPDVSPPETPSANAGEQSLGVLSWGDVLVEPAEPFVMPAQTELEAALEALAEASASGEVDAVFGAALAGEAAPEVAPVASAQRAQVDAELRAAFTTSGSAQMDAALTAALAGEQPKPTRVEVVSFAPPPRPPEDPSLPILLTVVVPPDQAPVPPALTASPVAPSPSTPLGTGEVEGRPPAPPAAMSASPVTRSPSTPLGTGDVEGRPLAPPAAMSGEEISAAAAPAAPAAEASVVVSPELLGEAGLESRITEPGISLVPKTDETDPAIDLDRVARRRPRPPVLELVPGAEADRPPPRTEPEMNLPDRVAPLSELVGAELSVLEPPPPPRTAPPTAPGALILHLPVAAAKPAAPEPSLEAVTAKPKEPPRARTPQRRLGLAVVLFALPLLSSLPWLPVAAPVPAAGPVATPARVIDAPSPQLKEQLELPVAEVEQGARFADPADFKWVGIKGLSWRRRAPSRSLVARAPLVEVGTPESPASAAPSYVDPDLQKEMEQ